VARTTKGRVIQEPRQKGGVVFAIRLQVAGQRQYIRLGRSSDGWDERQAEAALRHALADIERGLWKPSRPEPVPEIVEEQTFHEFSSAWFEAHKGEWREATRLDYQWQLTDHLLPFFRHHLLTQITVAEVDRYRTTKANQVKDRLSNTSINKTITRLGQILEDAVEYGIIENNPAKGKRRRLKVSRRPPAWLDSAEHIEALLSAAGELDREARADQRVPRRAILSTLVFSGLRIGELIELHWRDVNLADAKITVRTSKTDAGVRRIDILPVLADVLGTHKAGVPARPEERVFPTLAGGALNPSNVRIRILAKAVKRANERLEKVGATPLPGGLRTHDLRHTFASVLVALGTDAGTVMDQIGHTDPAFTLRVYRHPMREESKAALRALVEGLIVAAEPAIGVENSGNSGSSATFDASDEAARTAQGQ
jgi:integrase